MKSASTGFTTLTGDEKSISAHRAYESVLTAIGPYQQNGLIGRDISNRLSLPSLLFLVIVTLILTLCYLHFLGIRPRIQYRNPIVQFNNDSILLNNMEARLQNGKLADRPDFYKYLKLFSSKIITRKEWLQEFSDFLKTSTGPFDIEIKSLLAVKVLKRHKTDVVCIIAAKSTVSDLSAITPLNLPDYIDRIYVAKVFAFFPYKARLIDDCKKLGRQIASRETTEVDDALSKLASDISPASRLRPLKTIEIAAALAVFLSLASLFGRFSADLRDDDIKAGINNKPAIHLHGI